MAQHESYSRSHEYGSRDSVYTIFSDIEAACNDAMYSEPDYVEEAHIRQRIYRGLEQLEQYIDDPTTDGKTLRAIAECSELYGIDSAFRDIKYRHIISKAKKAYKRATLQQAQIDTLIESQQSPDGTTKKTYPSGEELRTEAEKIFDSHAYNIDEMTKIATCPTCPIDVTIDLMYQAFQVWGRSNHIDEYIGPILNRLEKIIQNKQTSIDVLEYIAYSEQLKEISKTQFSSKKAKDVRNLALTVFYHTGAIPKQIIKKDADQRRREKEQLKQEERVDEAVKENIKNAESETDWIRAVAARSRYTPVNILIRLATEDSAGFVREEAASNPILSPDALKTIAQSALQKNDNIVMEAVIKHKNCPPDTAITILETLIIAWKNEYGNAKWTNVDTIVKVTNAFIAKVNSPQMPIEELEKLRDIYQYTPAPLRRIYQAARDKLVGIHMRQFLGKTIPNPKRFPTDAELAEEEKLQAKQEALEQKRQEEETKKEQLKAKSMRLLEALRQVKEISDEIEASEAEGIHIFTGDKRITIPESELIIEVDGHREINPRYLPYINFINFALVDTENLKVSGIDWSKTNIRIDPQKVYGKDLSHARFSDGAATFANFEGCDLTGCDLSEELESYGFDQAIVDDQTKLHPRQH
ncbi:pentapeptide repeat-containing protein [Candidatus Saccharibacteria bacterium]|nr:pentapeptide repeat-containing protein [Candidatus Saccharibacteria bacterium]